MDGMLICNSDNADIACSPLTLGATVGFLLFFDLLPWKC